MRVSPLRCLLAAATVSLLLSSEVMGESAKRPNFLFIAVDDLNDWIGCLNGNPQCRTPNIDRLASRGLLFAQAHCAAPACNPSRAALMTGVRPSTSGVYLNPQPWRPAMPDIPTLPQWLMNHGYDAVGGGKIFHGGYNDAASWRHFEAKRGDPKPTAEVLRDPRSRSGGIIWGRLAATDEQMNDHQIVSWAIDYLGQPHEKSFFLACGIYRPHMPWQVPEKYYDMYPLEDIVLPKTLQTDLQDVPPGGLKMARPQGDHAKMLQTGNWKRAVQAYLASIAFADAQVGRLLEALDRSPAKEQTIVVLWGDHGWHLGEKQHWRKFSLWEEATRAPLMIVAPGMTRPATVSQQPVDFVNIYPTLVELAGLAAPAHLEGRSLVPILRDPETSWDQPALTTHGRNNHAVRDRRWRYIRYDDGGEELYDHQADPLEWKNLANDAEYATVKQRLAKWLPKTNAPNAEFDSRKRRRRK